MSHQKTLNNLFDFSDLRKQPDENEIFNTFIGQQPQSNENEALLRAFKQLRQKLKLQTRQINSLKDELKISNIKCRQSEQTLSLTLTNSLEIKQKLASSLSQNQQLKKKLLMMKETVKNQSNYYQQVQFTKQTLLQMKNHADLLQQERSKLMEMSLGEKMNYQAQINRLQSKLESDDIFIFQLEDKYNKARQTIIKLENQNKKLSINFEEEVFNKNWNKDNFETQHLLNQIKELERQVNILKAKGKKDKEKKVLLEDRIIELEELSGFHNVKAQTFQGQIDMITSKFVKLEKKYKDSKLKIQKLSGEKLQIQQNLNKLIFQNQQFIQKLKDLGFSQISNLVHQYQSRLKFIGNKKQKMQQQVSNMQSSSKKLIDTAYTSDLASRQNNFYSYQPINFTSKDEDRNVLTQTTKNNIPRQKSQIKPPMFSSSMTFGYCERQRENEQNENALIENRIRKQRKEMQRKIKQKLLHRKLQTSSPNEQFKYRSQYIRTFIDRKF